LGLKATAARTVGQHKGRVEYIHLNPVRASTVVDFSTMSNAGYGDAFGSIIQNVYGAPIANPDAPGVPEPFELFRSHRPGIIGKRLNLPVDSLK